MIGIVDLHRAEADLAAGDLACPGCGATLRRWGHARARLVRDHASTTLALRHAGRAAVCGPPTCCCSVRSSRGADATAVIRTALPAGARGIGYRRIATECGRPVSTVRPCVRSVRFDGLEVLDPGLVEISTWRPDAEQPGAVQLTHEWIEYGGSAIKR